MVKLVRRYLFLRGNKTFFHSSFLTASAQSGVAKKNTFGVKPSRDLYAAVFVVV